MNGKSTNSKDGMIKNEKRNANTVYEIIAAYRQATLHILNVSSNLNKNEIYIDSFNFDNILFLWTR